jgi:predicted amidohydrolase
VVGPDGLIGRYRKAHLFHFERDVFSPGDEPVGVWDTPAGRVAVIVCYDLRFAEAVRLAVLEGAEVLCVPTTWTDRGKEQPWDGRGWCGANYLAAGYAYGNRLWIACAARAGQDRGVRTLGCSAVFGPSGFVAAGPASPDDDAVLVVDADLDGLAKLRSTPEMDLVGDRRPELYEGLTRKLRGEGRP